MITHQHLYFWKCFGQRPYLNQCTLVFKVCCNMLWCLFMERQTVQVYQIAYVYYMILFDLVLTLDLLEEINVMVKHRWAMRIAYN